MKCVKSFGEIKSHKLMHNLIVAIQSLWLPFCAFTHHGQETSVPDDYEL